MFKSALIPRHLDKEEYKAQLPELRNEFLNLQFDLLDRKEFPLILVVEGVDGSGKADLVNRIYEWGDPHYLKTNAYAFESTSENFFPPMWRFWTALPPKGRIGIFLGSWYYKPLAQRLDGEISSTDYESRLRAINRFEELLVHEGATILKLWLSLPASNGKNSKNGKKEEIPKLSFKQWHRLSKKGEKKFVPAIEKMARITSTGHAPWTVIPSNDPRYRDIAVGKTICSALKNRLDEKGKSKIIVPSIITPLDGQSVLDQLDLSKTLDKKTYEKELIKYQIELSKITESKAFRNNKGLVLVFEGTDAAGKGSAIRRVVTALDPRYADAHAIAAPTDEEKAQPYLWRFWRRIPKRGHVGIFDRSWYGRVLVERVEKFCTEADWMRAYDEISDFEYELSESGLIIVKFWLSISQDEQLARFKAREKTSFKRYKLTDEDWRNRKKWKNYAVAVNDMVDRTSTSFAPWTLVAANCKKYARVKVLKTIVERIKKNLSD